MKISKSEIKNKEKEIDKAIRDNYRAVSKEEKDKYANEAKSKINELLERIREDNGKEEYGEEVRKLFENIRRFYMHKGTDIPIALYDIGIKMAEVYVEEDNLDAAEESLLSTISIIERDEERIQKVEKGNSTELKEIRKKIVEIKGLKWAKGQGKARDIAEKGQEVLKKSGIRDTVSEYEMFLAISEKLNIEELQGRLLQTKEGKTTRKPSQEHPPKVKKESELPEYLSPVNRLNFFMKEFPNMEVRQGKGRFKEYCVIEIPGLDSVIVERFFKYDRNGGVSIVQGQDATYIVPKEFVLDLLELSKTELKEFKSIEPRIKSLNHKKGTIGQIAENTDEIIYDSINYYRNFKNKFNSSLDPTHKHEYFEGFGFDNKKINGKATLEGKLKGPRKSKKRAYGNVSKNNETQLEEPQADTSKLEVPRVEDVQVDVSEQEELQTDNSEPELNEMDEAIKRFEIAVENVRKYTKLLNEAVAKNQVDEEIKKKLKQAMDELDKANEELRKY